MATVFLSSFLEKQLHAQPCFPAEAVATGDASRRAPTEAVAPGDASGFQNSQLSTTRAADPNVNGRKRRRWEQKKREQAQQQR